MAKQKTKRRKRGGYKGYWFYKGRGWYATGPREKQRIPLLDEDGHHLKDPNAKEAAEAAFYRFKVEQKKMKAEAPRGVTVLEACNCFIPYAKAHSRPETYKIRADHLYDFTTGYPPRFRGSKEGPTDKDRIHDGYGDKLVADLTPTDIQAWLDAHPTWKNTRSPVASVLRALNYCAKEAKIIPENPIAGIPKMQDGRRDAYFTPQVEQAIYKHASPALAMAVRVCIHTGARPGIEFASLEARHVQESEKGQIWHFPKEEAKGRKKDRVIFVPEEIAEIVRKRVKKYPTGKLFRNTRGEPWAMNNLSHDFRNLRTRLIKKGVPIAPDAVIYSARHTFAKRMLGGYWGTPVTLEILAGLMGNTPKVCWQHYAKWCPQYVEPFWTAISQQTPDAAKSA